MRHLLGILLLGCCFAKASDELWLTDLAAAKKVAEKSGKGILLEFTDLDN